VVVYTLLGGYLPFQGNVKESAMKGSYRFHDEYWRDISPSAIKLIKSLLRVDPQDRISMEKSLEARWMTIDDAELSVMDLSVTRGKLDNLSKVSGHIMNSVPHVSFPHEFQETMQEVLPMALSFYLVQVIDANRLLGVSGAPQFAEGMNGAHMVSVELSWITLALWSLPYHFLHRKRTVLLDR